jgi:hypothetical protein
MVEEKDRMKILIAYDGSDGDESAIDDLKRAGLPRRAEVMWIVIKVLPARVFRRSHVGREMNGDTKNKETFTRWKSKTTTRQSRLTTILAAVRSVAQGLI